MARPDDPLEVVVVGGGPAGVAAALRAADLGARTTLVTRGGFGGMAAEDGPTPVRTLAHAARLMREARQLGQYGVEVDAPRLDYPRLLARVREVVAAVRDRSALRPQVDALGVHVHEQAGSARFVDAHTLETERGLRLRADRVILCTGGVSRRLPIPGFELTATHSDAWALTAVPPSMIVLGAGATGAQVASVFNAFGTRVQLFQAGPRVVPTEDADVSAAVAAAFRASGIEVREDFGAVEAFERTPAGVRMVFSKDGTRGEAEAALVVTAVGWTADTAALNLTAAGVETDTRGFIRVDETLRTSAPHVFAAGDVTGDLMLVPQALQAGFAAASHALGGDGTSAFHAVNPIGSFTDPEYAQVGLTEAKARETHAVETVVAPFDQATRPMVDGRTTGFCKLVVERFTGRILGCHVVGERAVDIVQVAALAMAGGLNVDAVARIPLSFPTYAGVFGRAAAAAARRLNRGPKSPPTYPG
jgi:dihydrolipoamide dehydrogenase